MTRSRSPFSSPSEPLALSRRDFVRAAGILGAAAGARSLLPAPAWAAPLDRPQLRELTPRVVDGVAEFDLTIARQQLEIAGRRAEAVTINGTIPGPLLRLTEGQDTVLRVHNRLDEDTSIHWHGLIVPAPMDGVPGVSFDGIAAHSTFEYRFPLRQYGTYWYHSHSGLQEQLGHYGPLVVEPRDGYPYEFDREFTIVLSDWSFDNPYRILDRLKKQGNYYNVHRRTVGDFVRDVTRDGFMATVRERLMWLQMRMDPADLQDVTGATYSYLMNGLAPGGNWTGMVRPGERVLLRFVNASADSMFDVRIPELPFTVVQASGQFVEPVETDEFRISNAETYDVIVAPQNRPYTIFAESTDRTGFARGTLTPRPGWNAPLPPRRQRPLLTMGDMGMAHGMAGMDMSGMSGTGMSGGTAGTAEGASMAGMAMPEAQPAVTEPRPTPPAPPAGGHGGHAAAFGPLPLSGTPAAATADAPLVTASDRARYAVAGVTRTEGLRPPGTLPEMVTHEPGRHTVENGAVPMMVGSRLGEPGLGLGSDGWRVLVYTDLVALEPQTEFRAPEREIEIHLTGNMERFMWSINGVPFSHDLPPIRMNYNERVRLTMVNDTMMNHPMHLHGMFMELENGREARIPRIHTVNVKPAERLSLLVTADAVGRWAFHCHILYHMEVGMFRVFEVAPPDRPFTAAELADVV